MLDGQDIADALDGAVRGDEACFAVLWRALNPPLLRYLRVLIPGACEDVASETWLQASRDLGGFTGDAKHFQVWLFRIARNRVVIDGVRTAALGTDVLGTDVLGTDVTDGLAARVRASGGRLAAGLEADGRFAVEASVPATPSVAEPVDMPELRRASVLYYVLLAAFCARSLLYVPAAVYLWSYRHLLTASRTVR